MRVTIDETGDAVVDFVCPLCDAEIRSSIPADGNSIRVDTDCECAETLSAIRRANRVAVRSMAAAKRALGRDDR